MGEVQEGEEQPSQNQADNHKSIFVTTTGILMRGGYKLDELMEMPIQAPPTIAQMIMASEAAKRVEYINDTTMSIAAALTDNKGRKPILAYIKALADQATGE